MSTRIQVSIAERSIQTTNTCPLRQHSLRGAHVKQVSSNFNEALTSDSRPYCIAADPDRFPRHLTNLLCDFLGLGSSQ